MTHELDMTFDILRTHAKGIIIGVLIGCIIAMAVFMIQKPVWQATMIIGPTERTGVPSLSSFLPQGAADAPALQYFVERIDATHATDFTVFETKITSMDVMGDLYKRSGKDLGFDSLKDTQEFLGKNLRVRPHGLTPFKKVTLRHSDQNKATEILNALFIITDQSIRQDKKMKTNRRMTYLEDQLKTVRNPDHRDAIIALLKEQEQTAMMVSIDNHFAADIISEASVGIKPVSPNAMILFPAFIALGGFLGLVISGWRKHK
jgi:uncharacterized protein involved in exopolysaccharide biosynthesis